MERVLGYLRLVFCLFRRWQEPDRPAMYELLWSLASMRLLSNNSLPVN